MPMNRLTDDGRPILIDGEFGDAYNVHASTDLVDPDELDETIAAANDHAAAALGEYISGDWTLDVDATQQLSTTLTGHPTQPITVKIDAGGAFAVSAPAISLDMAGMKIELSLSATGQFELEARLEQDEVRYSSRVTTVHIEHSKADIAGMFDAGPMIAPLIEQLANASGQEQDVELEQGDTDDTFRLISPDVTHVLRRRRPISPRFSLAQYSLVKRSPTDTRVALSPKPYMVKQPNRTSCWATALSSAVNTIRYANTPEHARALAILSAETVDSVVTKMKAYIAELMADEHSTSKISVEDGTNTLISEPGYAGWTYACRSFGFGTPHYHNPSLDPLKLEHVADHIDAGRYVLINFTNPQWPPLPGGQLPWHVVVAYGYDTRLDKILVMDPASGTYIAVQLKIGFPYYTASAGPLPFSD